MSSLATVRRQRTAFMLAVTFIVVVALGGLLYAGAKALARYRGAKNGTVATVPIPVTPVGMLATVDLKNRLTSVAVFVEKPGAKGGGSVVNLPISTDSSGEEHNRVPLTDAYATGGADGLAQAVESALSLTIDQHAVYGPDQFTALLAPLGPFRVNFPGKVATTDKGSAVTLYPKGVQNLSAKQMTIAMNAKVVDQTEVSRLPTIQALWSSIAAANGQGHGTPVAGTPTNMDQLIGQVFAGQMLTRSLPVGPLPDGEVSDRDVNVLDRAEAVFVFATISPSNMSAANTGLTFRVEAPPGYDDRVKFAVGALLYANANVQWVYANGPVHPETDVFVKDPTLSSELAPFTTVFGTTVDKEPTYRIDGIDVIIQLGTDFLTKGATTLPSTTTTSTLP